MTNINSKDTFVVIVGTQVALGTLVARREPTYVNGGRYSVGVEISLSETDGERLFKAWKNETQPNPYGCVTINEDRAAYVTASAAGHYALECNKLGEWTLKFFGARNSFANGTDFGIYVTPVGGNVVAKTNRATIVACGDSEKSLAVVTSSGVFVVDPRVNNESTGRLVIREWVPKKVCRKIMRHIAAVNYGWRGWL